MLILYGDAEGPVSLTTHPTPTTGGHSLSPLAVLDKQNLMNLYCCNESCCTEWDQIKVVKQPFCDKNTH